MTKRLLIVALFAVFAINAQADTYLGVLTGYQKPSEGGYKNRIAYGVEAGTGLGSLPLSVGFYYLTSSKKIAEATTLIGELNASISTLHVNGRFHLTDSLYAGLGFGTTTVSVDTSLLGNKVALSYSAFSYGPEAGYDFKVANTFSLGVFVNYVRVPESSVTESGVKTTYSALNVTNALLSAKLWF